MISPDQTVEKLQSPRAATLPALPKLDRYNTTRVFSSFEHAKEMVIPGSVTFAVRAPTCAPLFVEPLEENVRGVLANSFNLSPAQYIHCKVRGEDRRPCTGKATSGASGIYSLRMEIDGLLLDERGVPRCIIEVKSRATQDALSKANTQLGRRLLIARLQWPKIFGLSIGRLDNYFGSHSAVSNSEDLCAAVTQHMRDARPGVSYCIKLVLPPDKFLGQR